jgi:branched-chain amino acid transport system substrate-binding protein
MSIAGHAAPIKLGVLSDITLPPTPERDVWMDMVESVDLVCRDAFDAGVIDRPVELVVREAEGLPRGTVKAVIDAYGELVDEGCLAVYGPNITENTVALRPEIERRFQVPAIGICGADEWLGEWTFGLPNGSMTDEPIVIAHLIKKSGMVTAGVLVERSLIGQLYLRAFRDACSDEGIKIVAAEAIAQTDGDIDEAIRSIHAAKPEALVHLGFGFGVVRINASLEAVGWNPQRYMGTAFENAFFSHEIWDAFVGWVGLEQYDEENQVGQRFLDRFEAVHGRRPEYFASVVSRDAAVALVRAFANAEPLSPRGVLEALERVKLVPAASGAPGTAISFGKWTRRGWMGAGYLTARSLLPGYTDHHLAGRYEPS